MRVEGVREGNKARALSRRATLALSAASLMFSPAQARDEIVTLDVGGVRRRARIVAPPGGRGAGLVVAFHGLWPDSFTTMPNYTGLDRLAAQLDAVVAYPEGRNNSWPIDARQAGPDLQFFDALQTILDRRFGLKRGRLWLAGMSNGGWFVNVVAQARAREIAAVAIHSGSLSLWTRANLKARPRYPVLVIHGAEDKLLKVGEGRRLRDAYTATGHRVEYWEVPRLGHFWAQGATDRIAAFFTAHQTAA